MKILLHPLMVLILYPICLIGQVQNNGNLRMHNGSEIGLFGDFTNNGTFTNNLGTLNVVGSNAQTFNGNNLIHSNNFVINKDSNALQLDNVLQIAGELTFAKGLILSDHADMTSEFVEFLDGATYSGANDSCHINGVIRKTGNEAFDFPTGNNTILRTIGIDAPSLGTDHFTAYYEENNPNEFYNRNSLGAGLNHVSACEYWILDRTGGSSDVAVTLSWSSNSCGVDSPCDLVVSHWDGAQWTSEGNGGYTGLTKSGTLTSGTGCSVPAAVTSFSPFTLGSTNSNNILPITLIYFEANVCGNDVCLTWETVSEINDDFFTVERSPDGLTWDEVVEIDGAGNSNSILNYEAIDKYPFIGVSYYRLKQTDYNGEFSYTPLESVILEKSNNTQIAIYPNPARNEITVHGTSTEISHVEIYNSMGEEVTPLVKIIHSGGSNLQLDISQLISGMYYVKSTNHYSSIIKQ